MRRVLSTLFLPLLLCSGTSFAAPSAGAELTDMLNEFLAGASINDLAAHERFWADDLIYTSSAGKRTSKAEILREVSSSGNVSDDTPETFYTAEDIRIQQYGDTAVVAFRLIGTSRGNGGDEAVPLSVQQYFNTGTFLKRNGLWQVVAWQATRIP